MPHLRILDYFIIIISISVVVGSVYWSSAGRDGELRAEVEASGEKYVMPLRQDGYLILDGPVGKTKVEVRDESVFISDSDCRDKICIAMGRVSSPSGWVACLPNRIFVRVSAVDGNGSAAPEVDSGAF